MYSLSAAAKATGKSKATIHRAIRTGKVSATRNEDGSYLIDPAELHRVFEPEPGEPGAANGTVRQNATPTAEPIEPPSLAVLNAALTAEIAGLKALLDMERERFQDERRRVEEMRAERDRWAELASQTQKLLTDQRPRTGWFGRLFRKAS